MGVPSDYSVLKQPMNPITDFRLIPLNEAGYLSTCPHQQKKWRSLNAAKAHSCSTRSRHVLVVEFQIHRPVKRLKMLKGGIGLLWRVRIESSQNSLSPEAVCGIFWDTRAMYPRICNLNWRLSYGHASKQTLGNRELSSPQF